MRADDRVARLFDQADALGLDAPTGAMIEEVIHDAEFDAIWNPFKLAREHNQDLTRLREIWTSAIDQSWRYPNETD